MPATTAAAISPWLCPTTAAGSNPRLRHTAASATFIANSARLDHVHALCAATLHPRPTRSTAVSDQSGVPTQRRLTRRSGLGKHRRLRQQRSTHRRPLTALARKRERHATPVAPLPADTAACDRLARRRSTLPVASAASRADTDARAAKCVRCNAAVLSEQSCPNRLPDARDSQVGIPLRLRTPAPRRLRPTPRRASAPVVRRRRARSPPQRPAPARATRTFGSADVNDDATRQARRLRSRAPAMTPARCPPAQSPCNRTLPACSVLGRLSVLTPAPS